MDRVALVVFDGQDDNTQQVAAALARGLAQVPGVRASSHPAEDVHGDLLEEADLLVIGGSTEYFQGSHHVKEFFDRIGGYELKGKLGFAFDIHAAGPLSGHASRLIERDLKRLGVKLLEPRHSVSPPSAAAGGGASSGMGVSALAEFETIGHHLGQELLDAIARRPPPPEDRVA
jgi:flavodoxin